MKTNFFSQKTVIPCYDTDPECRLKPAAFMNLTQEIAQLHADILGFGYDELRSTHTAWVLSRMHIRFISHPLWREEVNLRTWHKGTERLFYLRDFLMTDNAGKVLVEATTSWLVLNLETRRLVRNPAFEGLDTATMEHAIEQPCEKIVMPAGAEIAGEHTVSFSDIDMNGHTNNARYAVWAMDALDYELTSSRPVKEQKINFLHETKPGDRVTLYHAGQGNRHYVEGRVGDQAVFSTEFLF